MHKVAIISLLPVSATGGGESYTLNCAISVSLTGVECDLISPCEGGFCGDSSNSRLNRLFNRSLFVNGKLLHTKQENFRQVLSGLPDCRYIWIHQYLASKSVFDILVNTHPKQIILFTNLGFEGNAVDFWIRYGKVPNHLFVEISKYSADRTKKHTNNVTYVYAGVWQKQLERLSNTSMPQEARFVSVNRVLPHKAIEITIDALLENDSLVVIGPDNLDAQYENFLKVKSQGKRVERIGEVSADMRNSIVSNSTALVASSSTITYCSQKLEQSELLGLVLLEALLNNTIPISSSQPALEEVMNALDLNDFVYPERNSLLLRNKMKLVNSLSKDDYIEIINKARILLEEKFLWNDFWPRIEKFIHPKIRLGEVTR